MATDHLLTLTVEQAAQVLGIGRSTGYELVRTGDLSSLHLRRRIVVPVAQLADRLGMTPVDVWTAVRASQREPASPLQVGDVPERLAWVSRAGTATEAPALS